MHCLFEGISKKYLTFGVSPSVARHAFMFNTPAKLYFLRRFVSSVSVPHDFTKFRSLDHIQFFKASEFQNYIFYLFVPIYISVTPLPAAIHVLVLTSIVRLAYSIFLTDDMRVVLKMLLEKYMNMIQLIVRFSTEC